jgi:hypothetical protein
MVNGITGLSPAPVPLRDATAADKAAVRPKSQAEQTLDKVLSDMKGSSGTLAVEMARSRINQTRVRLAGLQLAAGSAAAMGDGRMARSVAQDIRDAARDLNRLFSGSGASGVKPQALMQTEAPTEPQTAAQSAAAQIKAMMGYGAAAPAADAGLDALKPEAAEVTGALKKVMKRLMLTGMNPLLEPADRGAMQQMFGAASSEIDRLQTLTGSGATVNLRT